MHFVIAMLIIYATVELFVGVCGDLTDVYRFLAVFYIYQLTVNTVACGESSQCVDMKVYV